MEKLKSCHPDLVEIFTEVVKTFDCTIICGERGPVEQGAAFASGQSKLQYPKSKHNSHPSKAIDVAPFPIDFADIRRITFFAGYVMGVAEQLLSVGLISHKVRWGGDWDSDKEVKDNKFNDLVHFELV
jgi:peptidoglycan L-alanyl-D-glutamate endopeptidase CwlK